MPVFIFFGWLIGLLLGIAATEFAILAIGFTLPLAAGPFAFLLGPLLALVGGLGALLAPLVAVIPTQLAVALALLLLIAATLWAYLRATAAIAPLLPAAAGVATIPLPVPAPAMPAPAGVAVQIPASAGEFFARGVLIGLSAACNGTLLLLIPVAGLVLGPWAFTVISLAAVIFVARNRFYQGVLGWSAWLFPLSYLATGVGLLLFVINLPFAFSGGGIAAFAPDFTTGVIETSGGLANGGVLGIPPFNGGFSLGNFTFLGGTAAAGPTATPGAFTTPSVSSHETGHTLNTAAMGGIVLWINAIDENLVPLRRNLAYGELAAEGHACVMPGTRRSDFSFAWWYQ